MNSIITLKSLVEMIATSAGVEVAVAENFMRAFTGTIREGLMAGEQVRIKDVGIFCVSTQTQRIEFLPEQELASEINAPFGFFENVKLNPGVTDDMLATESAKIITEAKAPQEYEQISDPVQLSEVVVTPKTQPAPQPAPQIEPKPEPKIEPQPEPQSAVAAQPAIEQTNVGETPVSDNEPVAEEPKIDIGWHDAHFDEDEKSQKKRPAVIWLIWAAVIGALVGFGIGYFIHDPIEELFEPSLAEGYDDAQIEELQEMNSADDSDVANALNEDETPESETEPESNIENVTTETENTAQAQPSPVYDTIRKGYLLVNMAKKHYGHKDFWVYIYLENKDKIQNPNRIPEGIRLVVPPLDKYAKQGTLEEQLAEARKINAQILNQYK